MLREFIEELKHNQNINNENNLENRIDIDYIIERLEDIQKELLKTIKTESYINDSDKSQESEEVTRTSAIIETITSKGVFKK